MDSIVSLRFSVASLACVAVTALTGCNFNSIIYRPDVPQGNLITKEMADQLQIGMTKNQVMALLGEPLVQSFLHNDRWDYTYYFNPRRGAVQIRHVTLDFDKDGRLEKIDKSQLPTEKQADSMILGYPNDFKPSDKP